MMFNFDDVNLQVIGTGALTHMGANVCLVNVTHPIINPTQACFAL